METRTLYFIIALVIQMFAILTANYIIFTEKCIFNIRQFMILSVLYLFAYSILYINFCYKN